MSSPFKFNVHRLSFILNNKCNMSCSHCFQHNSYRHEAELSQKDIDDFVNFYLQIETNKEIELTIIGGEPTLYTNCDALRNGLMKLIENGTRFKVVRLFSNGYKINESLNNVLLFLKDYTQSVDIWITKDIDPEIPDRVINGRSINDFVTISGDIYKKLGFNVYYQTVLTKKNIPRFRNVLDNIKSDKSISISLGYPCDDVNDLSYQDFEIMVNTFLDYISVNDVDHDFMDRCSMNISITSPTYSKIHYPSCDPIKGELSISPKGYLIPCVKCLDIEDLFSQYHISTIMVSEFVKDSFINKFIATDDITEDGKFCRECVLKDVCVSCRLLLPLINLSDSKIKHSTHKCDRITNFFDIKLRLIRSFIRNGGKNLWLEK